MIVDIGGWTRLDETTTGTIPKFWVRDNAGSQWLFKYNRPNTGEYWAEYLAAILLRSLDLPAPNVLMASFEGSMGSLSQRFVDPGPEQFYEGVDLLGIGGSSPSDHRQLEGYTLDQILERLNQFGLGNDFLALPVFDALIGHSDRHPGNWGIIQTSATGSYRLAPFYDNSASLSAEATDDRVKRMLDDTRMYPAYVFNRSKSVIRVIPGRNRPTHLDVVQHLAEHHKQVVSEPLARLERLDDACLTALLDPLSTLLSNPRRKFLKQMLHDRREALIGLL